MEPPLCNFQGQQDQLGISRANQPAQSTGKGEMFLRSLSSQVVNLSKEGGSTTSLDDFQHYLIALTVKKNISLSLCLNEISCISLKVHKARLDVIWSNLG